MQGLVNQNQVVSLCYSLVLCMTFALSLEKLSAQDRPMLQAPRLPGLGGVEQENQSRSNQAPPTLRPSDLPSGNNSASTLNNGGLAPTTSNSGVPVQTVSSQQIGRDNRPSRTVIDGNRARFSTAIVKVIEKIQLPARESGVLVQLDVREGQWITGRTVVGRIDDQQAKTELQSAERRLDASQLKISSDISIRYAEAELATATKTVEREREAFRKGVTFAAKVDEVELAAIHARLKLEKSRHDFDVDQKAVVLDQLQVTKADQFLQRHDIMAPWDGVVTKLLKRQSEWVTAGDPILELVQMDRLWIECDVDPTVLLPYQVSGQSVVVTLTIPAGERVTFPGQITFVDTESVGTYKIRAEVVNRQVQNHWLLIPGMYVEMEVVLSNADPNAARISFQQ